MAEIQKNDPTNTGLSFDTFMAVDHVPWRRSSSLKHHFHRPPAQNVASARHHQAESRLHAPAIRPTPRYGPEALAGCLSFKKRVTQFFGTVRDPRRTSICCRAWCRYNRRHPRPAKRPATAFKGVLPLQTARSTPSGFFLLDDFHDGLRRSRARSTGGVRSVVVPSRPSRDCSSP